MWGGGTTEGWSRLRWGRRSPSGSHAAQGGVHRIRAARGGRLWPSRRLQWLGARPGRARGAGGGDVAEAQAGGASAEGGAERRGDAAGGSGNAGCCACPGEHGSAGSSSGLGSGPGGRTVRSALRRAGSWIPGHSAPRPAPSALILHPPGFLSRPRPFPGLGR